MSWQVFFHISSTCVFPCLSQALLRAVAVLSLEGFCTQQMSVYTSPGGILWLIMCTHTLSLSSSDLHYCGSCCVVQSPPAGSKRHCSCLTQYVVLFISHTPARGACNTHQDTARLPVCQNISRTAGFHLHDSAKTGL